MKRRKLGFGFADQVIKATAKKVNFNVGGDWMDSLLPNFQKAMPEMPKNKWRLTFLSAICLLTFFILFWRVFHLQIREGRAHRELADGNRIKIKIIHATRGVIYDRNGKILANNTPAFRLKDQLITREESLELEVKNDHRVLELEVDNVRDYPLGEQFAHVIGYVGQISEEQLKKPEFSNYRPGDRIGQGGIEAQYESMLKGVDGGEIIEVDSKGSKLRTLRVNKPIPGRNIYLTIDADLQSKIYELLKKSLASVKSCCAAAVASDPGSGQILALLSFPSFNPNLFTKHHDESAIEEIFSNPDSPVLNRAIAGTYPPGSTFKIVSSLAALSSGKMTGDTIVVDNGVIYLGSFKFSNWYFNQYGKTEGPVNLTKAIARSNDIYFYQVGQNVGEKFLGDWAKKLLLGLKMGIDLPGEAAGLVPDTEWKKKAKGEIWYPGDTLHMAIGQGFVLTTPLQVNGTISFVAADGKLYRPQLLLTGFKSKVLASNIIESDKLKLVRQGLELVPKVGGTAWPFFSFPVATAGKTGTAEYGDPKDRTHAWYTSYAPADYPKIAMTVLVEGGGEGSSVAAPIVKEAYRWYFSEDKSSLIKDVYLPATESGRTLGE